MRRREECIWFLAGKRSQEVAAVCRDARIARPCIWRDGIQWDVRSGSWHRHEATMVFIAQRRDGIQWDVRSIV